MKLSIIIPTYNSEKVIGRALESILCQTFADYEVLVMDGVSCDETINIAQSYNDSKIRVFSEPDKGVYDAMNKGIYRATGEWLYFLGSDDWLYDMNVLQCVFSQDIEQFDVVYGEAFSERSMSANSGEWNLETLQSNRCHQAIFYKRTFLLRSGGYNLKYKIYADFDMNLKWFLNRRVKDKYIEVCIAHFSAGGLSDNLDKVFLNDFNGIVLKRGFFSVGKNWRKEYLKRYFQQSKIGISILKINRWCRNIF